MRRRPTDDAPADGIPDWVALTLETWEAEVWAQEIDTIGYRAPRPDSDSDPTMAATAGSTSISTTSGQSASSATARATTRLPAAPTSTPSRPTASSTTTSPEQFGTTYSPEQYLR